MRRPQKVIVDGYNVIYTDDTLRRVACRDLEMARRGLIERLREYLQGRELQVTLVFDGRGSLADAESVIPGRLQVMFSPAGQSADELILSLVSGSGNPRAFIVVTSDMADIGRTARGLGCEVIGSKRFLQRMGAIGEGGDARSAGADSVQAEDSDYWLEKFTGDENDSNAE